MLVNNKRLQTFDRVTTYPYGTNAFKVCEGEMLSKIRCNVEMINTLKFQKMLN